jgi:hypothetical protein
MSDETTPQQPEGSRQHFRLALGDRTPRNLIEARGPPLEEDTEMSEAETDIISPDPLTAAQTSGVFSQRPSTASSRNRSTTGGQRPRRRPAPEWGVPHGRPSARFTLEEALRPIPPAPLITEDQFQSVLQRLVDEGNRALATQKTELQQLSETLRQQQNEIAIQRQALERVWHGAETTFNDLKDMKTNIEQELLLLKTEQSGQEDRVRLLREQVVIELTQQWDALSNQLKQSTNEIAQAAEARIDASTKDTATATKKELEDANTQLNHTLAEGVEEIKKEVTRLQEWTEKGLDQEASARDQQTQILLDKIHAISKRVNTTAPGPQPTVTYPRGRTLSISPPPNRTSSPRHSSTKDPKAKEPPNFDGKSDELNEFLSKMDDYLYLKRHTYVLEQDKIIHAASYLTKDAYKWWKGVQHLVKPPAGGIVIWERYDDFRRGLEKAYSNQNEQEEARQELTLEFQHQKDKMIDYISRIRALNLKANLPVDRLWEHLYSSIHPKVREYLKRTRPQLTSTNHPGGLELAYQAILEAGQAVEREETTEILFKHQHEARQQLAARAKGTSSKPKAPSENPAAPTGINRKQKKARKGPHRAPSTTSTQAPSTQSGSPSVRDIHPRIRDARKRAGECIKCGKTGHLMRDCKGGANTAGKAPGTYGPSKDKKDTGKGEPKKVAVVQVMEGVQYGKIHSDDEGDKDMA